MSKRIIIAGGGTGGHIFPAVAIANAIKKIEPATEFLFIGAKGKMEMEKVPQAGYRIEGLDIAGYNRSSLLKNLGLPFKLIKSFFQVRKIIGGFKPDAVIGVGGYSSFPVLRYAQSKGILTFIHESNSFAGKSNIMLGKKATRIFTGTPGMGKFFPADRTQVTGNPVRATIAASEVTQEEGLNFFSLKPGQKTLLVVGGSLGARSLNEAVNADLDELIAAGLQVIWQTGKPYAATAIERVKNKTGVWASDFITKMEYAYAAADIIVARAGAMTVAEVCVAGKPVVFVPYPYAAEDHQTVNARQLVNQKAAIMIPDSEVKEQLLPVVTALAIDEEKQKEMSDHIRSLAVHNADEVIALEILQRISNK
ncbi:undecaprenyldiphospho-muramoylpentapeptide beta-N-acetylglucosaminyltransferase [Terrimonas ferruginea]|uniref:undecaprenyldiphospho-muramoylpentapeptide beta-N-acetylglucosaminyltransferase n=1 Tax=Terrimonas ferruginea TaxID=249 RepID=UPI0004227405|nr:undecaprenyldiphospho-muramoylpentapeptide beta-N-acetylglucosaminyltransferase [Terrimonas ferruginea]